MDILEAIYQRRSIRKYTGKIVSDKIIKAIIQAGMYAPTAVNKQPWHFLVFRDRNKMEQLNVIHPNSYMLEKAGTGIMVCCDELLEHDKGYGILDCSAATQNILLTIHAMGLGGCWVGIYPREKRIEMCKKLFQLPKYILPLAIVAVGYPDEKKSKPNRCKPERIHWDTW